ncbi:MAG: hypothetical protein M3P32_06435, partial [Chloroflexota bacterium]|nr:hypothetical protein [Chloroflexota bacterium]
MSRSTALPASGGRRADRLARAAERLLRLAADARLALGLLLLAGAWNAAAAALPGGADLLGSPAYLVLLALILCAGVASVGVRLPAAWREWRRPAVVAEGSDVLTAEIPVDAVLGEPERDAAAAALRRCGYRVMARGRGAAWSVA